METGNGSNLLDGAKTVVQSISQVGADSDVGGHHMHLRISNAECKISNDQVNLLPSLDIGYW